MCKITTAKFPERMASPYQCVWPDDVLMEHNSTFNGQSWALLGDCVLQSVQLLTVLLGIKSLVVAYSG